ncbi:hypothetical protein PHET_05825 [Paragonimus heterotremus]|uniref:Uncharacterized protein n=1 Tax=Paragonimus heterotremus TaxID=100268 RepID=A0A8J4WGN8_9TREM|nr:hypothetical protein PHET_05825 [Paragonimus heterotremus]
MEAVLLSSLKKLESLLDDVGLPYPCARFLIQSNSWPPLFLFVFHIPIEVTRRTDGKMFAGQNQSVRF